jgi:hypothetical protein
MRAWQELRRSSFHSSRFARVIFSSNILSTYFVRSGPEYLISIHPTLNTVYSSCYHSGY